MKLYSIMFTDNQTEGGGGGTMRTTKGPGPWGAPRSLQTSDKVEPIFID